MRSKSQPKSRGPSSSASNGSSVSNAVSIEENSDSNSSQDIELLGNASTASSGAGTSNPNRVKRSWIWTYFEETPDGESAICQATHKNGQICGSQLKKDRTGSTKNFHEKLLQLHSLADPKLMKKTKQSSHMDLKNWMDSESLKPKVLWKNY